MEDLQWTWRVCVLAQQQQQRLETMHKAFLESLHLSQLFFISFLHFPSGLTALPLEKNIELIKRHLLSSSVVVVVVYWEWVAQENGRDSSARSCSNSGGEMLAAFREAKHKLWLNSRKKAFQEKVPWAKRAWLHFWHPTCKRTFFS